MQFGVCASVDQAEILRAAGWDFIEESVVRLLEPETSDAAWIGLARAAASPLPITAANCLLPAHLKLTGPAADLFALTTYMTVALRRARSVGINLLVLGSGGSRRIPEGFDRHTAFDQLVAFARAAAPIAEKHSITLVLKHLHQGETNFINSLDQAMDAVHAVNHPNFQCLIDTYQFWLENEPLSSFTAALPSIRHVYLADLHNRAAPGQAGGSDFLPLLRLLKNAGYNDRICIDANWSPPLGPASAAAVLATIKEAWAAA